jgi:hypothetical protein
MRLRDTKSLGGDRLRQSLGLQQIVQPQGELHPQLAFARVWQVQIGEQIARADFDRCGRTPGYRSPSPGSKDVPRNDARRA